MVWVAQNLGAFGPVGVGGALRCPPSHRRVGDRPDLERRSQEDVFPREGVRRRSYSLTKG